eukprot:g5311.t1
MVFKIHRTSYLVQEGRWSRFDFNGGLPGLGLSLRILQHSAYSRRLWPLRALLRTAHAPLGYDSLRARVFCIGCTVTTTWQKERKFEQFVVNQTLTSLYLWDNKIGDEGAAHIAAAVKENKTVIELRMGANKIGPAGAEAIASMLKGQQNVDHANTERQQDWAIRCQSNRQHAQG